MVWKLVSTIKEYLDKCKRDNIGAFAAQAAFFMIMSAIPFTMVFTSLLQYTPISEEYVMTLMYDAMPGYIQPFMRMVLSEVYSRSIGISSLSAVVALWAAGKALQYMASGFNVVNDINETRSFFVVRFWSIVYTLVLIFAIIIVLGLMVFNEHIKVLLSNALGTTGVVISLVSVRPLIRGVLVFAILTALFVWFFTVLPNKKVGVLAQIPGAVICAAIWYVFSILLALYVRIFDSFSIYGSMSTLVLLMFWLYSCMYIMFMCAEANVMFQKFFKSYLEKKKEKLLAKKS